MSKGEHLGEFEQLVLLALMRLGEKAYGMKVRREIEERSQRSVSIGAAYATLDRLEEKGYVRSWLGESTPERGRRAKRFFRIEAAGEVALRNSLRAVTNMAEGLSVGVSD